MAASWCGRWAAAYVLCSHRARARCRPAFGVRYADLGRPQESIGVDRGLDLWLSGVGNYVIADALAKLVELSPHSAAKSEAWRSAR